MAEARRSAHIHVMVEAAQKAGRSLIRDFGEIENLQVSRKGPGNFVSTADLKSEKIIRSVLEKARPKFGFLLEEGGEVEGEDKTSRWIVDPLDGTTNFLHSLPHWCISIALEKNKEIIAGVIYDPVRDEMFTADKGTGAYCNNRRIMVSARDSLAESLIGAYAFPDVKSLTVIPSHASTRSLGSACLDLAYVAAGRLDGFFHDIGIQPWDAAAGGLLVKEARGKVTSKDGGKDFVYGGGVVAGNGAIHAALSACVSKPALKAKTSS